MTEMDRLLRRHEAFWKHEPADAPLIRLHPFRQRVRLENMDVTPDILDVETLTPALGKRDYDKHLLQGDLFNGVCPFSRVPWMEAIVGCEIHAGADEAMWPKPCLGPNYEGREHIIPGDDNPWLRKLVALTQALVEGNDGSYVVTHTLQRGPSDMLSALIGDNRMGLAFYDDPDVLREVLAATAQALINVARAQYALIPAFQGGWVPWAYGLWAPGSVIRFQSDSASQLSPRMYAEHILPHDRTIMRAFDYSIIDLHSGGTLHLHKPLMEEAPELNAISVTLDRYENAPSVEQLLPTLAHILTAKSLHVVGEVTPKELEMLKTQLPARGLCINVTVVDKLLWQRRI
jgi:hypothetical protein